jgi:hypothetical protein
VHLMLNAGDIASMGILVPFSIAAGVALGLVSYKAQMNRYGDDKESAKIRRIILGLLAAIPTPRPAILYIPSGMLHGDRAEAVAESIRSGHAIGAIDDQNIDGDLTGAQFQAELLHGGYQVGAE